MEALYDRGAIRRYNGQETKALKSLLLRHHETFALALAATVYVELRVAGFGPEAKGVGSVFAIFTLSRLAQAALHFVARKLQP